MPSPQPTVALGSSLCPLPLRSQAGRAAACAQDILTTVRTSSGGTPMTVAEATTIADNALEHSVRTVLASLEAPLFLAWRSGAPDSAAGPPACA